MTCFVFLTGFLFVMILNDKISIVENGLMSHFILEICLVQMASGLICFFFLIIINLMLRFEKFECLRICKNEIVLSVSNVCSIEKEVNYHTDLMFGHAFYILKGYKSGVYLLRFFYLFVQIDFFNHCYF